MASISYAIFQSAAEAEPAVRELSTRNARHPNFAVQSFDRGPLDGNALPESGTEVGRNTLVAVAVGGAAGALMGLAAGLTERIIGLGPGMGAAVGALFGVIVGLLSGMMAGTREPKAALRALAEQLDGERVLVTVETDDPAHAQLVLELLRERGGTAVGSC